MLQHPPLRIAEPVRQALAENQPVIALESTIISHGMPYPRNVETALSVEEIVRKEGAVPATIALMDGKICVGLDATDISRLGQGGPDQVTKCSRRDIAQLLQQKKLGATTVAATMIAAHLAGIRFFATGGIGGVHRGGEETLDISADLQELARTPVAVIASGAKSILDLPKTLEYLETMGVPVWGIDTPHFPAFFTPNSGLPVDRTVQLNAALTEALQLHWLLPQAGGVLLANPIPRAYALEFEFMESLIQRALTEAKAQAVTGKRLTPFLLARLEALSQGKSLEANIMLIKENARTAARIARLWASQDSRY
jgi:pseudouridine-5'-phosphate glycosidase